MEYIHEKIDLGYEDLDRGELGGNRLYSTPDGRNYPSVTTVLQILNEEKIAAWKEKVGEEEAARISKVATDRGTAVHEIMEKYLNNEPTDGYLPHITQSLDNLKTLLGKRLSKIYAVEQKLYSDHLKLAGTVDCVGVYDGEPSIIDFKTSRYPKRKTLISNYFIQGCAYAIMWEERTGMPINNITILMDVDNSHPLTYKEKRDPWVKPLKDCIKEYIHRRMYRP